MTARWPLVIFYNILDVSAYNAFVIWTEIFPEWNESKLYKRRIFLEELGKALVTPHIQRRQHLPRTSAAASTVREIQERTAPSTPVREVSEGKRKRKRCQVCRPCDDVDCAHRLGARAPEAGERPCVTIARIHSFQAKEIILQLARQVFPLRHNDKPVYIFRDYPAEITKQRRAFVDVRKRLEGWGARGTWEQVGVPCLRDYNGRPNFVWGDAL
ncbi:hypothetical protein WMY93_014714 [Mugilogobius chulae]|uniref:PiggyBac transposable element-derived protein domain-containing protein n=1 Tax=Mugilogobius chulae TaxID=88201 RepID=A0AAW0P1W0_9GOBI